MNNEQYKHIMTYSDDDMWYEWNLYKNAYWQVALSVICPRISSLVIFTCTVYNS